MAYPVARYLGIDTTESPAFTPGGELVFLADTTGTPQVWTAPEPGGWPERLTAHEERISFVAASPAREEVVFGMDRGSNERDQLFRYDLADGTETALTDRPETIHRWGAYSPDGGRIAFAANRREGDTFDVYVQGRDGDEPTLLHEGPGGFLGVEAWGGPGIAVSRAHASFDQDLYLLDPETGSRRRLTDDGDDRYAGATFADGSLYCITNRGSDTAYAARIDPGDGETVAIREGGDWNVGHLAVEGGRVVWSRNVDGYSEVRAGRLEGDRIEPVADPDLPAGVVSDVTFAPGGGRYAVAASRSDVPGSVYVVDFETGETERFTRPGTLGIPESAFREPDTVRYETFDGREIPAYWTLPESASEGETPVIVDIHGGPEHQRRPWFYPTKQYFLNEGYAVFEPNVRGSSGYGRAYTHLDDVEKRMDSVRDVREAVGWLRARPEVDPDRIVAYGRSYGGFMVLASITEYPDLWAAAVEFVGIANFVTFLENTGEWRRGHREREYGSLEDDRGLLEEISPIHRADRISCPLFIQHGANDPRVPVSETEEIAETLQEHDVPVETLILPDEGHHTTSRENLIEEFERIAAFLTEHVR